MNKVITSNRKACDTFESVLDRYLSRRGFLKKTSLAVGAMLTACENTKHIEQVNANPLSFIELPHGLDDKLHIAPGYNAQVLIGWGDPISNDSPTFNVFNQTEEAQLNQFGYNNDFIGFIPYPLKSRDSNHGLLIVNHEYTLPHLMFSGSPKNTGLTKKQTDIDIAAHGLSVIEVTKSRSSWRVELNSRYARRITPHTPMVFSGAATGSDRLKTNLSPDGIQTRGTYGNCAGGVTPWGTILTGEENVDGYFTGNPNQTAEAENYKRFGMRTDRKLWGKYYDRWNLDKNPREPLHVGWVVEIDPFDPTSKPKKLTSLGRFKHEGCNVHINTDGHVVAYTGDDQRFEYIYKFVSKNKYDPTDRKKNMRLLEDGILYVARFEDTGKLVWLPLTFGLGPLTNENGFSSQADICIDTRKAADLVGATPMDRPEDIEVNPQNSKVYAMLTNNSSRKENQTDAANPKAHNGNGQILEFFPISGDHTEHEFSWNLFLLAGNPEETLTQYHSGISENGWLSCPDNCAFDDQGNLWIATDGAEKQGIADGLWATEVKGKNRAKTKHFLRVPKGAELCGPFFTPDNNNLFVSIQHPGEKSSFDSPHTRWPDFSEDMPPRPSVVVITKYSGGKIGS